VPGQQTSTAGDDFREGSANFAGKKTAGVFFAGCFRKAGCKNSSGALSGGALVDVMAGLPFPHGYLELSFL